MIKFDVNFLIISAAFFVLFLFGVIGYNEERFKYVSGVTFFGIGIFSTISLILNLIGLLL